MTTENEINLRNLLQRQVTGNGSEQKKSWFSERFNKLNTEEQKNLLDYLTAHPERLKNP